MPILQTSIITTGQGVCLRMCSFITKVMRKHYGCLYTNPSKNCLWSCPLLGKYWNDMGSVFVTWGQTSQDYWSLSIDTLRYDMTGLNFG